MNNLSDLPYWRRSQILDELGRTAEMEDRYGPLIPVRSAPECPICGGEPHDWLECAADDAAEYAAEMQHRRDVEPREA